MIELYNGDCRTFLSDYIGAQFDAVITDPPYASNGKLPIDRPVPVLPGVFRAANVQGVQRIHQTQKPEEIMRQICKICLPGGRILDPFAGSGSTLAAAELEGYDSVGVELSEEIAKSAAQRLNVAMKKVGDCR